MKSRLFRVIVFFLLISGCKSIRNSESEIKFSAGEHMWVGDEAFAQVCMKELAPKSEVFESCRESKSNSQIQQCYLQTCKEQIIIPRKDAKAVYSYGQIIALADFYYTPSELYSESSTSFRNFFGSGNDIKDLKDEFQREIEVIKDIKSGNRNANYQQNHVRYWWNSKDYLAIAKNNEDHFGWNNIVKYVHYHSMAIDLGLEARHQLRNYSNLSKEEKTKAFALIDKSFMINAFADHFLSDAFSSGHIRLPRKQMIVWAEKQKTITSLEIDLMSLLLHDLEGSDEFSCNEDKNSTSNITEQFGFNVKNSLGDRWTTFGDTNLFAKEGSKIKASKIIVIAIEKSLEELFEAIFFGKAHKGVFKAIEYVPFPDYDKEAFLASRICTTLPSASLKNFLERLPLLMRLKSTLIPYSVRKIIKHVPQLMQDFRLSVKREYEGSSQLKRRLPLKYVNAYQNIELIQARTSNE